MVYLKGNPALVNQPQFYWDSVSMWLIEMQSTLEIWISKMPFGKIPQQTSLEKPRCQWISNTSFWIEVGKSIKVLVINFRRQLAVGSP